MSHLANTPFRTAPLREGASPGRDLRLEVIARWGDEVLAVAHLGPGERFALTSRAEGHARGTHALIHPALDEGAWTFAEHTPDGRCLGWRRAEDDGPVALEEGDTFGQRVGEVCLIARRVRTMGGGVERRFIGGRTWAVVTLALGLLALLVAGAASLRVPPFGEHWAGVDCACAARDARTLRALMADWPARSLVEVRPGVHDVRAYRPRYVLGGRYRIRDNPPPHLTRQQARERVQSRGIFAALPACADEVCSPVTDPFAWVGCHALVDGRPVYEDGDGSRAFADRVWATSVRFLRGERLTLRGRVAADGRLDALRQTRGSRSFHRLLRALGSLRVSGRMRGRAFECEVHV